MRSSTLALCGFLPAACLYPNPAFDPASDGSSGGTAGASTTGVSTTGASTTGASTTAAVTTGADATTSDASSSVDPTTTGASTGAPLTTGSTSAGPDLGGPAYPHYPVFSCSELRDLLVEGGDTPASGYFNLDVAGGETVDVYCDMDIAGGGWTLVGRSAGDEQLKSFGWLSARGDVADDGQPYSLDLGAHPIDFTEILLGECPGGKTWGDHAYRFTVGPGYVKNNVDAMQKMGQPEVVLGGCTPLSFWMFQYGGETDVDQAFFFRDIGEMDSAYFGLLANGFYLHTYMTCGVTGDLNHKHGMLMVR